MAPTLYIFWGSPPVCAVLMTARTIGLDLNLKEVDLLNDENKTPQYLKLNPQHTVPTLVDSDGFTIWESHAIMPYLLSKYSKDDSLYPNHLKQKTVIDQRLHFNNGVAFAHVLAILRAIRLHGEKRISLDNRQRAEEIYEFVEAFLDGKEWIAGNSLSVADFSFITTLATLNVMIKISSSKYPRLVAYLKRATTLPTYDLVKKTVKIFETWFKSVVGNDELL